MSTPHRVVRQGSVFFWLHWAFVAVHRLSLVAMSRLPIAAASLVSECRFEALGLH